MYKVMDRRFEMAKFVLCVHVNANKIVHVLYEWNVI